MESTTGRPNRGRPFVKIVAIVCPNDLERWKCRGFRTYAVGKSLLIRISRFDIPGLSTGSRLQDLAQSLPHYEVFVGLQHPDAHDDYIWAAGQSGAGGSTAGGRISSIGGVPLRIASITSAPAILIRF